MKTKTTKIMMLAAISSLTIVTSCKDKDKIKPTTPTTGSPQEVITTMKLLFSNAASAITTYQFKDPDGDGGIVGFYGPGTTTASTQADSVINLLANNNYTVTILLLDETKTPVDTISNEVIEEATQHLITFNQLNPSPLPNSTVSIAGTNLEISYRDTDGGSPTQYPLGLKTSWIAGAAASKKEVKITLRHQPGIKDGTFAPGDTDIEIPFKVKIN
jgi:hypothetical protein